MAAKLTAMRAGWVFAVRVSSSAGPSQIKLDSFCDRAASTSSNTARACGKASASAAHPDGLAALAWEDECPRHDGGAPPWRGGTRTGDEEVKARNLFLLPALFVPAWVLLGEPAGPIHLRPGKRLSFP